MKDKKLLYVLGFLILVVIIGLLNPPISDQTTVIVVRHAEKSDTPVGDVSLNEIGKMRAETLIDVLGNVGITKIYSTQYARNIQTVKPLAENLGLEITISEVDHSGVEHHVKSLANEIRSVQMGETILVVGHSNTVPMIVEELAEQFEFLGPCAALPPDHADRSITAFLKRIQPHSGIAKQRRTLRELR